MTHADAEAFVQLFEAAWNARDGEAMRELWHPDGTLFTPVVDRPVSSDELPDLVAAQLRSVPDLAWHLVGWAFRGNVIYVEWRVTQSMAGSAFEWRGMDRLVMRDGKIAEERVYADTAPMRMMSRETERHRAVLASRIGVSPTPMISI